jgi:uncharacterized protein involved in tolerance to divalent cations
MDENFAAVLIGQSLSRYRDNHNIQDKLDTTLMFETAEHKKMAIMMKAMKQNHSRIVYIQPTHLTLCIAAFKSCMYRWEEASKEHQEQASLFSPRFAKGRSGVTSVSPAKKPARSWFPSLDYFRVFFCLECCACLFLRSGLRLAASVLPIQS